MTAIVGRYEERTLATRLYAELRAAYRFHLVPLEPAGAAGGGR